MYSFKARGYKEVLENYASYLNLNHAKSNETSFWTSCKQIGDEIFCEPDSSDKMEWKTMTVLGPGLFLSYLTYHKNRFRLNYLNTSQIMDPNDASN